MVTTPLLSFLATWSTLAPQAEAWGHDLDSTGLTVSLADGRRGLGFGPESRSAFGFSVCGLGDVDGDGVADIAVGAPLVRVGEGDTRRCVGAVSVHSGSSGKLLWAAFGEAEGDELGRGAATTPDSNGDGVPELVAFGACTPRLLSGRDGSLMRLLPPEDDDLAAGLGRGGLSPAGDLDGDGHRDIVFGNPSFEYFGADCGVVTAVSSGVTDRPFLGLLLGKAANDLFGTSVSAEGDFDGDGVADVLVGAPRGNVVRASVAELLGQARAFSGKDGRMLFEVDPIEPTPGCFGHSVVALGDVDGDGRSELAVGDPGYDYGYPTDRRRGGRRARSPGSGVVDVFSGSGEAIRRLEGRDYRADLSGAAFGYSLTAPGDLDGDGRPDLVVGAYSHGGSYVVAVSPGDGETIWRAKNEFHEESGFGGALSSIEDLDGDGAREVVVGALWRSFGAPTPGRVVVLSSGSGERLLVVEDPH